MSLGYPVGKGACRWNLTILTSSIVHLTSMPHPRQLFAFMCRLFSGVTALFGVTTPQPRIISFHLGGGGVADNSVKTAVPDMTTMKIQGFRFGSVRNNCMPIRSPLNLQGRGSGNTQATHSRAGVGDRWGWHVDAMHPLPELYLPGGAKKAQRKRYPNFLLGDPIPHPSFSPPT